MTYVSPRRRREEIVRIATTHGQASVITLAERFQVSASTIRRDLASLESERQLARTHGGAMAPHAELSLRQRSSEAYEAKQAIARWAASIVESGESLMLDGGSTVALLAQELRNRTEITVTTISLVVLNVLAGSEQIKVNSLGGTLRPLSQAFVGPLTESALETITFDRAFLGADSVDAEMGICEADPEQTRLKELMARRASNLYVMAHAAKLGQRPFHAWTRLHSPWTLVTDGSDEDVEPFRHRGIDVVQVPSWHS
jgi:DeoR/GlpR family transcriptional regulator of sugar metabolism